MNSAAIIQNNPTSGWYWAALTAKPFAILINSEEHRFALDSNDDNDNLSDDYINFYSGDKVAQGDRPYLIIDYYVPWR
jgi:hypothetical protein